MSVTLFGVAAMLVTGAVIFAFFSMKRRQAADLSSLHFLFESLEKNHEKTERALPARPNRQEKN